MRVHARRGRGVPGAESRAEPGPHPSPRGWVTPSHRHTAGPGDRSQTPTPRGGGHRQRTGTPWEWRTGGSRRRDVRGLEGKGSPDPPLLAALGRGEGRPVPARGQPGAWGSLAARAARGSRPRRSEPAAPRFSLWLLGSFKPPPPPPGPPAPPEEAATGAAGFAELPPPPAPGRLLPPGRTGACPRPVRPRSLSSELEALRRGSEPVSRGKEQGCRRAPGPPGRAPLRALRDPRPGAARGGRGSPASRGSSALLRTRAVFSRSPEGPFSPLPSHLVSPTPRCRIPRCPPPCAAGRVGALRPSGALGIPCRKFPCLAVPCPVVPSSPCPLLCTSGSLGVVTSAVPGASVSPALRCRPPRCPSP